MKFYQIKCVIYIMKPTVVVNVYLFMVNKQYRSLNQTNNNGSSDSGGRTGILPLPNRIFEGKNYLYIHSKPE